MLKLSIWTWQSLVSLKRQASGYVCGELSRLRDVRSCNSLPAMLCQNDKAIGAVVFIPLWFCLWMPGDHLPQALPLQPFYCDALRSPINISFFKLLLLVYFIIVARKVVNIRRSNKKYTHFNQTFKTVNYSTLNRRQKREERNDLKAWKGESSDIPVTPISINVLDSLIKRQRFIVNFFSSCASKT